MPTVLVMESFCQCLKNVSGNDLLNMWPIVRSHFEEVRTQCEIQFTHTCGWIVLNQKYALNKFHLGLK